MTNASSAPLYGVRAVGTFYDWTGVFLGTARELIDYNPLLPGQTSKFRAKAQVNPAFASCEVSFKYLGGGAVDFEERW